VVLVIVVPCWVVGVRINRPIVIYYDNERIKGHLFNASSASAAASAFVESSRDETSRLCGVIG
jgi:hypothetical protein